jgi:hypothetical protein
MDLSHPGGDERHVLLPARSALIFQGEARYVWRCARTIQFYFFFSVLLLVCQMRNVRL